MVFIYAFAILQPLRVWFTCLQMPVLWDSGFTIRAQPVMEVQILSSLNHPKSLFYAYVMIFTVISNPNELEYHKFM